MPSFHRWWMSWRDRWRWIWNLSSRLFKEFRLHPEQQLMLSSSLWWSSLSCTMSKAFLLQSVSDRVCPVKQLPNVHMQWWVKLNFESTHTNSNILANLLIASIRPINCANIPWRILANNLFFYCIQKPVYYLNAVTLFVKNEQEMTPLEPFNVTQLIDFAVNRLKSVTPGCDFCHCITAVTRNVLECIQQKMARSQAVDSRMRKKNFVAAPPKQLDFLFQFLKSEFLHSRPCFAGLWTRFALYVLSSNAQWKDRPTVCLWCW